MSKFTNGERSLVKNIVANLTIKRIAEEDIIKVIFDQTGSVLMWYVKLHHDTYCTIVFLP